MTNTPSRRTAVGGVLFLILQAVRYLSKIAQRFIKSWCEYKENDNRE